MNEKDYIFCKTCDVFVDYFVYGHDIRDAGHENCNWRYVTIDELKECIAECEENNCFGEEAF
jgi:hypothetical protein